MTFIADDQVTDPFRMVMSASKDTLSQQAAKYESLSVSGSPILINHPYSGTDC